MPSDSGKDRTAAGHGARRRLSLQQTPLHAAGCTLLPAGGVTPDSGSVSADLGVANTLLALSHAARSSGSWVNRKRLRPSITFTTWTISSATVSSSALAPTWARRPSAPWSTAASITACRARANHRCDDVGSPVLPPIADSQLCRYAAVRTLTIDVHGCGGAVQRFFDIDRRDWDGLRLLRCEYVAPRHTIEPFATR